MKRLKDLEQLALGFEGVNKCYAMQAGRELRVMVDADNVSDETSEMLSFDISQKIEKEMRMPAVDVYRSGAGRLMDALERHYKMKKKKR